MDHRFELRPADRGTQGPTWEVAEVFVDGRNLVEILREIELPFAEAEGNPSGAGEYDGLPAVVAFLPSRYYLGEPPKYTVSQGYPAGKIPVLVCTCGEEDCNSLLARITLTDKTVTWSEFENYWSGRHSGSDRPPWTYERLGELTFNRAQYEAALGSYHPRMPEKTRSWRRTRRLR